ncbi:TPA: DUF3265 domain-containing protein, partial [Vibrio vulnificus]|nr:DUF3265 domain-containing protein [Vibrio vulnificus]
WHFWYAVSFSGESGLQKAGLSGIHPLTQRYAAKEYYERVCRSDSSCSCWGVHHCLSNYNVEINASNK